MKKLLESDWPRAVQFSSNTTEKRVTLHRGRVIF